MSQHIIYSLKKDRRVREFDTRSQIETRSVYKRGDLFEGSIVSTDADYIVLLGMFGETYSLEKDCVRDVTEYQIERTKKIIEVNKLRA